MKVTTIDPPQQTWVIVRGPLRDAVLAYGRYSARALRNVSMNGYGSIHADADLTPDDARDWFSQGDNGPGALLFCPLIVKVREI